MQDYQCVKKHDCCEEDCSAKGACYKCKYGECVHDEHCCDEYACSKKGDCYECQVRAWQLACVAQNAWYAHLATESSIICTTSPQTSCILC